MLLEKRVGGIRGSVGRNFLGRFFDPELADAASLLAVFLRDGLSDTVLRTFRFLRQCSRFVPMASRNPISIEIERKHRLRLQVVVAIRQRINKICQGSRPRQRPYALRVAGVLDCAKLLHRIE